MRNAIASLAFDVAGWLFSNHHWRFGACWLGRRLLAFHYWLEPHDWLGKR